MAGLPEDVKQMKKLTAEEFVRTVNDMLQLTKEELGYYIQSPNRTAFELLIGSILHKAVAEGDIRRAEFLLDRIIGKPTQMVMIEGVHMPRVMITLPDNGRPNNE